MKVLFDQGTPVPLRRLLPGHEARTAYEMGWSALLNGELLRAAEAEGFPALGRLHPGTVEDVTFEI